MLTLSVKSTSSVAVLKDGSEVPKMELLCAMSAIRQIANDNLETVRELLNRCKDSSYPWTDTSIKALRSYHLIGKDAKVSDHVQKVVLNAVVVDGLKITIVNPKSS